MEEAKQLIGQLYKQHVLEFFQYAVRGDQDPLEWFRRFDIQCRTIGLGFASHGMADYLIGGLGEGLPTMKARGYKLYAPHFDPFTEKEVDCSMKPVMWSIYHGDPIEVSRSAYYRKPAAVGEVRQRRELRDMGVLSGDTIHRMASPKIIPYSEFHFDRLCIRRQWMKHYKYLNQKYAMGLEAAYLDEKYQIISLAEVKKDIQCRIHRGDPPKRVPSWVAHLKSARQVET